MKFESPGDSIGQNSRRINNKERETIVHNLNYQNILNKSIIDGAIKLNTTYDTHLRTGKVHREQKIVNEGNERNEKNF